MRLLLLLAIILSGSVLFAQDDPISADEVNTVAKKMYCPVCENIPLDACGTAACVDWRNEIRIMLAAGQTEAEIIDDFVLRFGDRVVGVPQSDAPRLLSLLTPWLLVIAGIILSAMTVMTWRKKDKALPVEKNNTPATIDSYRQQLERDLLE
ncbi:MAG: cytochrome c-type biogenesis protein [Aggregatilineales bacterium]